MEGGFFWSVVACFLALESGIGGPVSRMFLATAGLLLVISLIETSYRLAYVDELTSLPGRRAFQEQLLRLEDGYAVAMLDVDHFKQFNDQFGHETGDHVLRMVAAHMEGVSGGGAAYRVGGEEFAVVFPVSRASEALPHLELLRQEIGESVFMVRRLERRTKSRGQDRRQARLRPAAARSEPRPVCVTVSIGLAGSGPKHASVESVVRAADAALYAAKEGGRNRVEMEVSRRVRPGRSARQRPMAGTPTR